MDAEEEEEEQEEVVVGGAVMGAKHSPRSIPAREGKEACCWSAGSLLELDSGLSLPLSLLMRSCRRASRLLNPM